jgi:hypothetical protein
MVAKLPNVDKIDALFTEYRKIVDDEKTFTSMDDWMDAESQHG